MTAAKLPNLEVTDVFWTLAGHLFCAPVLAVWLYASPAMAQSAPVQPKAPSTPVSPLTVEGTPRKVLEKQARDFVDAYGAPTRKLGVFARWSDDPACIVVAGLVAEQAAEFKTRIEAVAKAVRAPVAPAKCSPNIEIVFTTEPQRYLDAAAAKNPAILGDQGAKTVTRPIQAWYATATQGVAPPPDGGLKSQGPVVNTTLSRLEFSSQVERFNDKLGVQAARRCVDPGVAAHNPKLMNKDGHPVLVGDIPCLHSMFFNVLVVVDAAHMGDVNVDLASDYLALLALSQPNPQSLDGCLALPSVLDLYAKDCPGREAPTGLTPADRAYLIGLYTADLTVVKLRTDSEQSEIAGRMVNILVNPNAPTVDPGLCPTNPETGEVQCPTR